MADGVLARQCWKPDRETLRGEVEAWQKSRNRDAVRVNSLHHRGCPHQAEVAISFNSTRLC